MVSSYGNPMTELRGVTCHGCRTMLLTTYHLTQLTLVNTSRLNPIPVRLVLDLPTPEDGVDLGDVLPTARYKK